MNKKLMITLSLVLVMILACVPVFANQCGLQDKELNLASTINRGDVNFLNCKADCYPIWVATVKTEGLCFQDLAGKTFEELYVEKMLNYMNGGAPMGWVQANTNIVRNLQIANAFLAEKELAPQYKVAEPVYNNIMEVKANVAFWEQDEVEDENAVTDAKAKATETLNAEKAKTPTVESLTNIENLEKEIKRYNELEELFATYKQTEKKYRSDAMIAALKGAGFIKDTVVPGSKDVMGYVIVVEDTYVDVTINHHKINAEGEDEVETVETQVPMNDLVLNQINPEWIKDYEGYVLAADKTTVGPKKVETNILVNGVQKYDGYEINLYYMAGEAEGENVDGAQNATVQLPATGANNGVAVALSSLALIALGLFIKK